MGENAAGGFFQHAQSPELGGNEENQEIRGEFQSKRSRKTFFIRVNTLNINTQAGTIPTTSFTIFGGNTISNDTTYSLNHAESLFFLTCLGPPPTSYFFPLLI